uniref:Large ribosomal subunit protein eL22 n=1 Tax=Rhinopithecus bieti TaxID=61621 RepID=A0A2K6LTG8_RHIBE
MDAANFEQFLQEGIKVNGKARNLGGGVVTMEWTKSKITMTSEKNNLCDWLHVVANSEESYELCYFQISQDKQEEEDEGLKFIYLEYFV